MASMAVSGCSFYFYLAAHRIPMHESRELMSIVVRGDTKERSCDTKQLMVYNCCLSLDCENVLLPGSPKITSPGRACSGRADLDALARTRPLHACRRGAGDDECPREDLCYASFSDPLLL